MYYYYIYGYPSHDEGLSPTLQSQYQSLPRKDTIKKNNTPSLRAPEQRYDFNVPSETSSTESDVDFPHYMFFSLVTEAVRPDER